MNDERKQMFVENLKKAGGIIYVACECVGINRSTYYRWRGEDAEFAEAVDEVKEGQIDYVESKLMNLINGGDTTATIFYLKTRGKQRGWTEKPGVGSGVPGVGSGVQGVGSGAQGDNRSGRVSLSNRIRHKRDYIVKLLKQQGKYTAELSMQVKITAQLLVRTEVLADEVLSDVHEAVKVEISREGNERITVNPKERLYLDFVQQSQRALRALGMNTDAKERKVEGDALGEFLKEFSEG